MPPIKIDTPQGPIYIDPTTGDIVAAPTSTGAAASYDTSSVRVGGGPSGSSALGGAPGTGDNTGSGIPTTPGSVGGPPAGPAPHVVAALNLGNGVVQYQMSDGTYVVSDPSSSRGGGGGGGGGATAGQVLASQGQAASLAENQRQFDLMQGERKAREDQQMRLAQQAQEIGRGNTLLGLGSRPDTLIKYLYALQGQQTPQGIQNTTTNLPGYQNVIGRTNYGTAPAMGAAPLGPAPTAAPAMSPAAIRTAIATPGAQLGQFVAPGGTNITQTLPAGIQPQQISGAATATQGPTDEQLVQQRALIDQGRTPRFYSNGVAIFKHGGPIPEHVVGVGLKSGKTYEFGEKGPEFVIPHNKVKDLMSLLGKGMREGGETDAAGNKAYATGGSINYDPTNVPAIGSQSSGFFNDPNLKAAVSRGYNSNPGVPLFPQVSLATGGGSSLVPSAQRLNALLPSEQSLYAGTLQDEFGANPEDVFAMARKLAPQIAGLRIPRYSN